MTKRKHLTPKRAVLLALALCAAAILLLVYGRTVSLGGAAGLPEDPEGLWCVTLDEFAAMDPLEFRAGEGMEELARAVGRLRVRYAGPFQEGYMARSGQEAYTFRAVPYDGADALGEPVEFFFRDDGYILADGRHFEAADPAGLEELLELFRARF